ncbi:NAD(+) synthase [Pseudonocardia sp. H11422]|uniref:NAD(+) synthase n=1 Tax=Pseudonocardia sp. H11422 TaxID=2835866 RepID=UPI001BDD7267|nr:NAD(+) synthase [Pseudonocardia sp. H11422]
MPPLRIAVAQLPNRVGDLRGNTARITAAMDWAEHEVAADVLVLPELTLTGYGLRDLVLQREFVDDAAAALAELVRHSGRVTTVVSTIDRVQPRRSWDTRERDVAICAVLLSGGEIRGKYHKILLPLYEVFDEARHFAPGHRPDLLWRIGDVVAGVVICEDMWSADGPPEAQSVAGAQILLVPNASPFHRGKAGGRLATTCAVARRNGLPIVYVNTVGGQDELTFDGGSIVVDADGEPLHRGLEFAEDRFWLDVGVAPPRPLRGAVTNVHTRPTPRRSPGIPAPPREPMGDVEAVWHAIATGVRDYVAANDFHGVALGLSGGIDSAVTAALAADAVGPDRVLALAMPSSETAGAETTDARKLAENLGISIDVVPVDTPSSAEEVPTPARQRHVAESPRERERRYARSRAAILGDIFSERGYLVLATGNKSEISIGEASLLGDLAGGFAPLKDCLKTVVYELAAYRQERSAVFPSNLLHRRSTMQRLGSGPLTDYEVLDDIIRRHIELGESLSDIVDAGHDPDVAQYVLNRIARAERTRRSAPPGVRVTSRAFGQDLHMPISNAWRAHLHRPAASTRPPVAADVTRPQLDV